METCFVRTGSVFPAMHVLFRVGGNHDPKGKEGLSHFLEHMMLRRNDNNKIIQKMKEHGALSFNAVTSRVRTDYWLRAHYTEKKAWASFKQMIEEPVFEDYEKEKGVIIEEIRRRKNNPESYAYTRGMILLLGKRLGLPAAGTEESVKKITGKDLEKHYENYYTQRNCVIVSAGSREPAPVPAIRKGGRKPRDPKPRFKTGEYTEEKGLKQERILVLWPTKETGKTADALRIYVTILRLKGKLFREIRVKRGWAYDVHAFTDTNHKNFTLLGVGGGIRKGKGEKAVKISRQVIEGTRITGRDMKLAKKILYYNWLSKKENTGRLAADYANEIGIRDRTPEERIESMMSLKKEDVLKARDFLEEPLTLVVS